MPFDPSALVEAGFDVAGLGVGTTTDPVMVRDFSPYLYTSPEPGKPLALSVFSGAAAIKRFLWEVDATHEVVARNISGSTNSWSADYWSESTRRSRSERSWAETSYASSGPTKASP